MRILFDPVTIGMRNKGNIALLQAAIIRASRIRPNASLEVLTEAPYLLKLYCPNVRAISPDHSHGGMENRTLLDTAMQYIPRSLLRLLFELREEIWLHWPSIGSDLTRVKLHSLFRGDDGNDEQHVDHANKKEYMDRTVNSNINFEALNGIDLFVATGAQYMSDPCRDAALRVLDRLERAVELDIATAMVGQGVGPLNDPGLRERARVVLPLIDLIFVREKEVAIPLLDSLGVKQDRVVFTGDDAIEMAYNARTEIRGTAIGVTLRVAPYTQTEVGHGEMIRVILQQAAAKYRSKIIAIPISHSAHELDNQVLERILAGLNNVSYRRWRFDKPLEVIRRVGRCRLVVTGAFHTAIFALAQGIPVVSFAKSEMYMGKFLGLADQFNVGCQVVCLDDENFQKKLLVAIDTAWECGEQLRLQLLETAERHAGLARAAYQRLFELVERKKKLSMCGALNGRK